MGYFLIFLKHWSWESVSETAITCGALSWIVCGSTIIEGKRREESDKGGGRKGGEGKESGLGGGMKRREGRR